MTRIRKGKFNGKDQTLIWNEEGYWVDQDGTKWADTWEDPGYCGLDPLETGDWDPFHTSGACPEHDHDEDAANAGYRGKSSEESAADFTGNSLVTMAKGAYALVMGVPYILIGGIGGLIRQWIKGRP